MNSFCKKSSGGKIRNFSPQYRRQPHWLRKCFYVVAAILTRTSAMLRTTESIVDVPVCGCCYFGLHFCNIAEDWIDCRSADMHCGATFAYKVADLKLRTSERKVPLQNCGYPVAEVFHSSCGIAIADLKKVVRTHLCWMNTYFLRYYIPTKHHYKDDLIEYLWSSSHKYILHHDYYTRNSRFQAKT